MIWIPRDGAGKVRTFSVSPRLCGVFSLLVFLCLCAVPCMERGLISLQGRVTDLEREKGILKAEILTLHYLKSALNRIEEKEKILRHHFGMEKYQALEQAMGLGGNPVGVRFMEAQGRRDSRRNPVDDSLALHYSDFSVSMVEKLKALASDYEVLNHLKVMQGEAWENTPSIVPVALEASRISSGFGLRKSPLTNRVEFHAGVDFVGPRGTKIIAPASGKVLSRGYDRWLGHFLVLQHASGIKTIYGHFDEISLSEGMKVGRGDLLGFMGNTGLSTSPHLHYAVVVDARAVDPLQFILDMGG